MALSDNAQPLNGASVAILVTDGFEQVELTGPRDALEAAGASTKIISERHGKVQGFNLGSSRVDLQACKLEYSIVSPK